MQSASADDGNEDKSAFATDDGSKYGSTRQQTGNENPNKRRNGEDAEEIAPSSTTLDSAAAAKLERRRSGYLTVGYRGTFAFGRGCGGDAGAVGLMMGGGRADVKFRRLTRILVCGRVSLCRDAFGDQLSEMRDPDRGAAAAGDRYTARFYLKHAFIEQAFDRLGAAGFRMVGACASATNSAGVGGQLKPGVDVEETRWNHYNEFVFCRP